MPLTACHALNPPLISPRLNELFDKLQKGEKWEELVPLHSDDPGSSKKGGELAAFGSGTTQRMVPAFEDAAFALKADGDISKPIRTDYGFHIIKRLEWKDVSAEARIAKIDIEEAVINRTGNLNYIDDNTVFTIFNRFFRGFHITAKCYLDLFYYIIFTYKIFIFDNKMLLIDVGKKKKKKKKWILSKRKPIYDLLFKFIYPSKLNKMVKKNENCDICMDDKKIFMLTSCNHLFCIECIFGALVN
jgi:hypothetical protein